MHSGSFYTVGLALKGYAMLARIMQSFIALFLLDSKVKGGLTMLQNVRVLADI